MCLNVPGRTGAIEATASRPTSGGLDIGIKPQRSTGSLENNKPESRDSIFSERIGLWLIGKCSTASSDAEFEQ
jgi:hypothetical protein